MRLAGAAAASIAFDVTGAAHVSELPPFSSRRPPRESREVLLHAGLWYRAAAAIAAHPSAPARFRRCGRVARDQAARSLEPREIAYAGPPRTIASVPAAARPVLARASWKRAPIPSLFIWPGVRLRTSIGDDIDPKQSRSLRQAPSCRDAGAAPTSRPRGAAMSPDAGVAPCSESEGRVRVRRSNP